MIERIVNQFGVQAEAISVQKSGTVWIVNDKYVLKQSSGSNITKSAKLAESLLAASVPVSAYMKTITGDFVCEMDGKQYCLMTLLHGKHINPFQKNPITIGRTLGSAVASLDKALKNIVIDNPYDADFQKELDDWIMPEIEKAKVKFAGGVVSACRSWLPLYQSLPRQFVHRDLHTDNMLFEGEDFTGFIDFEMSQINARIFDVCYLGCTLLVSEYTNESQCLKWQKIFSSVLDGYITRCPLTDDEFRAMPMMFIAIEIIFTAFYCKMEQPEIAKDCIKFVNWLFDNQDMLKSICGGK